MASLTLSGWITLEIFRVLLVFTRITAAMMMLPGFGEPAVPVRVRILAGLAMAAAVAPGIAAMPTTVPDAAGLGVAVLAEAIAGAMLGILCRTLISAVLMAGQVISQTMGMTNIFAAGMAVDQSATLGAVIYAGVAAVLFASGGYQHILRGLVESYQLLPPAHFPSMAAGAQAVVAVGERAIRLAGQIALPFLVLALLFNASLAAVNRAMPALPVFNLGNPVLVLLGLYLMATVVPGLLDPALADWSDLAGMLR